MSFSVKPGSPLKTYSTFVKIVRFIKNKVFELEVYIKGSLIEYNAKAKIKLALKWLIDVSVTGLAIQYCLKTHNFFSYGLISVLAMYYINWLIELIKKPISKK